MVSRHVNFGAVATFILFYVISVSDILGVFFFFKKTKTIVPPLVMAKVTYILLYS